MPAVRSKVVDWQNEAKFTGLFKGVDPRGQLAGSIEGVLRRRRLRRRRSIWFNETDGNVLVRGVSTAADDADGADANAGFCFGQPEVVVASMLEGLDEMLTVSRLGLPVVSCGRSYESREARMKYSYP